MRQQSSEIRGWARVSTSMVDTSPAHAPPKPLAPSQALLLGQIGRSAMIFITHPTVLPGLSGLLSVSYEPTIVVKLCKLCGLILPRHHSLETQTNHSRLAFRAAMLWSNQNSYWWCIRQDRTKKPVPRNRESVVLPKSCSTQIVGFTGSVHDNLK